jgi:hypothetical protein
VPGWWRPLTHGNRTQQKHLPGRGRACPTWQLWHGVWNTRHYDGDRLALAATTVHCWFTTPLGHLFYH